VKVIGVRDHGKRKEWTYVQLLQDDGKEVEAFSMAAEAKGLQEGPLPSGWTIEPGGEWPDGNKKPPNLRPPGGGQKGGGGGGGYRNTKEGQQYEQERMDRRTAVMQAIAAKPGQFDQVLAEEIYKFLRK
jgi:hypothetical protein